MCEHCIEDSNHLHHNHEEEHEHEENISFHRIILSVVLLMIAFFCPKESLFKIIFFTIAYLTAGYSVILDSLKNIIHGKVFDENFLMSIAATGAFIIGEYAEAVAVMLLYILGEYFQHKAVHESRSSISKLMNIKPEYANVEVNGQLNKTAPEKVCVNDTIVISAGEKIPLDGVIIYGNSYIDTASLTGESSAVYVKEGDEVLSGTINKNGLIKIRVTKLYKDSTVAKILELIENASHKKSRTEKFITKFAKYYTPCVVIFALMLILVPFVFPVFGTVKIWVEKALTFLVISCPCALVLSVPLTFFGGIGGASSCGILIKGSNYMEALSKAEYVLLDKTGTLTKGTFEITEVLPENGISKEELIETAALAEYYSLHPIAVSLKNACAKKYTPEDIISYEELSGLGVKTVTKKGTILAGNSQLIPDIDEKEKNNIERGTQVNISLDSKYIGKIVISDELKPTAKCAVDNLKKLVKNIIMLTGDNCKKASFIAQEAGINEYYYSLLPDEKVKKLEEILEISHGSVIFAGDGINDAPVLMRADVGIAMGNIGSDSAIEAADVVISDDNPQKICTAIKIAKKTMRIAKQNIILAIGIKILFLILCVFGMMTMWGAVFADVGVTFAAVINSLRTLKVK
ncbi:MAG: cadmium-translocating P-type ATPase [Candidatus Gastranaerophilales bacterium]|nr:cadmium-translocating P-type ATPase [Candidatus Gastranaerophilales bacterium]